MKNWKEILGEFREQPYFKQAMEFQANLRRQGVRVYPREEQIFNAFRYTPADRLKVVILGQDPYHEPGQAMGLSFSVPVGQKIPPSLQNVYHELRNDLKAFAIPKHGNLIPWARQGVLLLNTVLTVSEGEAGSHRGRGWEEFTDAVVARLNSNFEHLVFMLWGRDAGKKGAGIDRQRHLVLEAAHPSPFSAYNGFFGCSHFSQCNAYLMEHGISPIDWQLPTVLRGDEEL